MNFKIFLSSILIYFFHVYLVFAIHKIYVNSGAVNIWVAAALMILVVGVVLGFWFFISDIIYSFIFYTIGAFYSFLLNFSLGTMLYFSLLYFSGKDPKKKKKEKEKPDTITKYKFPLLILGPGLLTIYGLINALILHVSKETLTLPELQQSVTIAHLTDVHLGAVWKKSFSQKIVNKLIELNPDIVVITGDLLDGTMRVKSEWLEPFNQLKVPILYVTGNHEEEFYGREPTLELIKHTNIHHLGASSYKFKGLNFVGVDYKEDLTTVLKGLSDSREPNIILNHIPSLKEKDLEKYNVFLMLSGHTHGAQVFPLHVSNCLMRRCFKGLYSSKKKNSHIYVSSGLGTSAIPMRTFSESMISLIVIKNSTNIFLQ